MLSDGTDGTRVTDLYAIAALLNARGHRATPATLRQWARRYPDRMPVMGSERRRKLYAVDDVCGLAEWLDRGKGGVE